MVYFALGVLVVTLSVTVYSYRYPRYLPPFLLWKGKETLEKVAVGSQDVGEQDDKSKGQDSTPTFTLDNGEGETSQSTFASDEILNTATASKVEPKAQSQSPPTSDRTMMPPPAHTALNAKRKIDRQAQAPLIPPSARPSPKIPTFKAPPKPSTALRPPPSTASTLRAPPSTSLKPSTASLAPSISTLAPSSRPSKKVLLDPGHSPLDWAHLTANPPTATFLRGAGVPPNLIRVPPSALRYHTGRKGKDAWGVYQGKVYNLTPYLKFHPGGVDELMRGAGKEKEGEKLFTEIHPWVSWENMLAECLIGILVSENDAQVAQTDGQSKMDEMD